MRGELMTDEKELILSELERLGAMLYKNEQLFDIAVESSEIDALIYERKALRLRYSALIVKAKELGIKGDEMVWRKY